MDCFLGIDLGSSSVKVSILDGQTGNVVAKGMAPKTEAPILSVCNGWAEQNPDDWWTYLKTALRQAMTSGNVKAEDVKAVGITYQMHGLVLVDKDLRVLRPSIIWCDSRAVPYGEKAFEELGHEYCLTHLLNSPGNFTVSKLAWVRENEPEIYNSIYKYMLPGDYLAMRMTGEVRTTVPGLSEGMCWTGCYPSLAFRKRGLRRRFPHSGSRDVSRHPLRRSWDCVLVRRFVTVPATNPTTPSPSMC